MSVVADRVIVEMEARLGKYNADVNAARANFDRNMGQIRGSAATTERQVDLSAARMGQAFGRQLLAGASVTAIVAGLLQIGGAAAAAARQAEELDSAIGFTFGRNAAMIQAWADKTGEAMGRASTDLKQAALDFQTIFGPALGADAGAEMSKTFAVLVQDVASFRNVSEDIVRQNLIAGLVGETEPLRKFGVIINENMVKTKAYELGLVSAGQEVNDYGKIVARLHLIQEGLAKAQGDVERTSESSTNKLRAAGSASKELGEEIGKSLNPALAAMAGLWTTIAKAISGAIQKQREFGKQRLLTEAAAADRTADLRERDPNPAFRGQAAGYRKRAADLRREAGAGTRQMGTDRQAEITRNAEEAEGAPSYVATAGGGRRGRAAKPRYAGRLPDNVLAAIAEGRLTEESARTTWPTGDFPASIAVEQELMSATGPAPIEGAYDLSEFSRGQAETMTGSAERLADALGPGTEAYLTLRENFASSFADGAVQALRSGDVGQALQDMLLQWGVDGFRQIMMQVGSALFDASGASPTNPSGGGVMAAAAAIIKLIPTFASGTASAPGGLAYVHKDELINLPRGSQVYTAAQTRAMGRGSGGSQPVSVHISLSGANGDRTIAAIARQATAEGVSAGLNAANRSESGRRFTEQLLGARPLT